jgi:predicted membrane channel-forming protein YqfA (hemolysin III family)
MDIPLNYFLYWSGVGLLGIILSVIFRKKMERYNTRLFLGTILLFSFLTILSSFLIYYEVWYQMEVLSLILNNLSQGDPEKSSSMALKYALLSPKTIFWFSIILATSIFYFFVRRGSRAF